MIENSSCSSLPDEALVRLCATTDDPLAWREFLRRFTPVISRQVVRSGYGCLVVENVEDLVQQVLVRLCSRDRRALRDFDFRYPGGIYGYFKKVATTVVRDHHKREAADKRPNKDGAQSLEDFDVPDSADRRGHAGHTHRQTLLRELEPFVLDCAGSRNRERNVTIFWLRHNQGMTMAEIATLHRLGLNEKGVGALVERMVRCVREKLAGGRAMAGVSG